MGNKGFLEPEVKKCRHLPLNVVIPCQVLDLVKSMGTNKLHFSRSALLSASVNCSMVSYESRITSVFLSGLLGICAALLLFLDLEFPTYGSAFSQVAPSAPRGPPAYQSQYQSEGEPENLYEPVKRSNSIARTLSFETKEIDNSRELSKTRNPYQSVLSIAGKQLEAFDEDGWISTCIF